MKSKKIENGEIFCELVNLSILGEEKPTIFIICVTCPVI